MNKKHGNPLISDSPGMTFERIEGMLELLRSVDYSGLTGMMQDALRHENSRRKATKEAS